MYHTLHRFPRLDGTVWRAGEHPLGRGMLHPDNVSIQDGQLRLCLPAGTCDGAELRSRTRHLYGSYAARLQSCPAPGSITAFFLYQDVPGGNDEIDIEIVGGEPHRAIVAAWVAGRQTHAATVSLPWNPSEAPHDYTIDFHPGQLSLYADGAPLARWTSGLPTGAHAGHAQRLVADLATVDALACRSLRAGRLGPLVAPLRSRRS